jgi:hypothetical protein
MNQQNKQVDDAEPETGEIVSDEQVEMINASDLTLNALARQEKGVGAVIAKAKVDILKVFRESSIGLTYPEDWLLFKRPEEQGGAITAFLADAGCKRILPLWGIDVLPEGGAKNFQVDKEDVGDDYLIVVRGDGYNRTTGSWIRGEEGCRGSDEDFVKSVTGTKKLSHVRKAAFRNLAGNITRKSTGLDSVPLSELQRIWGNGKDWNLCAKGKGLGGSATRYGDAASAGFDDASGPACPVCGGEMKFIKKDATPEDKRSWAFWGCKKGKGKCPGTLKDSEWQDLKKKRAGEAAKAKAAAPAPATEEHAVEGELFDEPPGGEKPVSGGEPILGVEKQKLLDRIKGKPYEKQFKAQVIKCSDLMSVSDLATMISDAEKGVANG